MRILTLLIIFILLPGSAMAASAFTPPPTDKSVELLGSIFGSNIGSIWLGGAPNPALSRMFELFNVVVISIGTIIVSYIGIISTINTAQEGKTMGRKGNFWIPLRATLGMLLIVPTPASGYSIVQTTVMWLIIQGIGAADQIWNSVLADLGSGIAIGTAVQRPKDEEHPVFLVLTDEGQRLTDQMLRSAVCMLTIHDISARYASGNSDQRGSQIAKYGRSVSQYVVNSDTNYAGADRATFNGTMNIGVRGIENFSDICGKYTINTSVTRDEWDNPDHVRPQAIQNKALEIYSKKKEALGHMFSNLIPIAQAIVNQQAGPRDAIGRLKNDRNETVYPAGYKNWGTEIYVKSLSSLVRPQHIPAIQEIVQVGSRHGWISAGSFFFALNNQPDHLLFYNDVTVPIVAESVPSCNNFDNCTQHLPEHARELNEKLRNYTPVSEHSFIANRLWDAKIYFARDDTGIEQSIVDQLNRQPGAQESNMQRDINEYLSTLISEKDLNPMVAQGKFGAQLMKESEDLWRKPLHEQQELINNLAERNGFNDVIARELKNLIDRSTNKAATFLTVYSIVWICGATMAIYIPLIPYMMFTVAVLGWFLLVIEAIVAAPILALSFILPAGEELGKIMQGLMLLLNIILRPTLMLFGFVLASRLYSAIVQLVNFSMLGNFSNVAMHESLFASVAVVCIYVMFILALSNKCFALIYALPDKILRWMGGSPEHTDATQEMQQAKGVMSKGADAINKISSGFAERGFARLQSRAKNANQVNQPDAGDNPNNHDG